MRTKENEKMSKEMVLNLHVSEVYYFSMRKKEAMRRRRMNEDCVKLRNEG